MEGVILRLCWYGNNCGKHSDRYIIIGNWFAFFLIVLDKGIDGCPHFMKGFLVGFALDMATGEGNSLVPILPAGYRHLSLNCYTGPLERLPYLR